MITADELEALAGHLTDEERAELDALLAADMAERPWVPLPGPQTMAYYSEADVIGFGGAAGGGKTDLACGIALNEHYVSQIFRREGTEITAIVDRMTEIVGHRDGLGGKPPIWRDPAGSRAHLIEFGSCPNLGDEKKFQGRAKDLLVIDEAANFLEAQVRFLMGWVRSTRPGQRKRTLLTFNPPTTPEGRWVLDFFAPWISPNWPAADRAQPGEIRWVAVVPSENGVSRDIWFGSTYPGQFVIVNGKPVFDFDPADHTPQDIVTPQSRTFVPSRITDNPHLANTGYMTVLQSMPEPLRSQMLYGDFGAGLEDDAFQVIPTAWVKAAMKRWTDRSPKGEMESMGVDVARGGKDNTVIAARHAGNWYDRLKRIPGTGTPDGGTAAAHVLIARRSSAPIHVDGIGVGSAVVDALNNAEAQVISINVSEASAWHGKAGNLTFYNLRSESWWRMREELDPANDTGIALPPDPDLERELCTPKWEMKGKKIYVQSREEIVAEIGRSPDAATAVILAQFKTPNLAKVKAESRARETRNYDPIAAYESGRAPGGQAQPYDPLAKF